ncbi:MAG: hypothetical protein CUN55_03840 [Phototrophicales bacterium]|nr:MAG: hypothetical protein CUN55_03840 [Phototrophicales bacterium]
MWGVHQNFKILEDEKVWQNPMETQNLKTHLIELSQLTGPSGHEKAIREYLRQQWQPLVDEFSTDKMGSLIAIKRGNGPEPRQRIMLAAHMDEIGLMVNDITDGYLRVVRVGGTDTRTLLAKSVTVHAYTGDIKGTVAIPPPHITNYTGGTKKYPELSDIWIDLGLSAEEVAQRVRIGDLITLDAPVIEFNDDVIATKAMDDRASVAAVTACLHYLQSRHHAWDVYAVATVQEEVGLVGARSAAYEVHPHLAIAIDVGFASQHGVSGDTHPEITEGPQIGIGPNFHEQLRQDMMNLAESINIKLLPEPTPSRSGTDAWEIQISHEGIPTALLSIPCRNMHTTVETVSVKTVQRTGRFMAEFISSLPPDYLDRFNWLDDDEADEDEK